MKNRHWMIGVMCWGAVGLMSGQVRLLRMDEMFQLADRNSKSINLHALAVDEAEQAVRVARNGQLPTIQAAMEFKYIGDGCMTDRDFTNGIHADMPHYGNSFVVKASQVVYAGGKISRSIEQAELNRQVSELEYRKNRQDVRFLLLGHYLDLYQLHNQQVVYQKNIEQTRLLVKDMQAAYRQGTALKSDITRYELQLQNLELGLQHLTPVNTRVQGFIKRICFDEYQRVKKGDTLVIIEDTEYRLKVAQAEADYQSALAGKTAMHTTINTTQNNILVTDAAIEEQRVRLQNAEADFKRYEGLLKEEAVTPQQFDRVKTDYEATKARYEQLLRQKQSTSLVKQEQTQRLDQNESAIKLAEAELELARLNLSYTVILATADGVTGRKEIHEGELVQQGQTLVTLVDGTEKWVIANYKETQTTRMQRGQLVDIQVDALPGVAFEGRISSISDATGSFYSLIPQDNSAGNFVKVEQRIPVRIEFTARNRAEDLERLRAGMNVECTVSF